ncbi:MAG: hypothetical protein VX015_05730 [Planctomycetota bacterium]|nr:hypothetical protein [Planctomycetota bacterium]
MIHGTFALAGAGVLALAADAPAFDALATALEVAASRAPAQADDPALEKRNNRAIARIDSALELLLDDVHRAFGAEVGGAARAALVGERKAHLERRLADFDDIDEEWAQGLVENLVAGEIWRAKVFSTWTEEQRAGWRAQENGRRERTVEASIHLATVLLATETRLRAPEVAKLRRAIEGWIEEREPTLSEVSAGDLVEELLTRGKVRDLFLPVQSVTLLRMREAKKPVAPSADAPGDDLALGRGRYPEDDYTLEAAALCLFHGWEWSEVPELARGAAMLGREARRSGSRPMRFGDSSLFKTLTRPDDSDLWRALVARRRAKNGASAPAPAPLYTDDPSALIDARVDLILAHLDERLRLDTAQMAPLRAALRAFVQREHAARARAFGALDPPAVWRELRFVEGKDPRRGSSSRRRMCAAMDEALTETQRVELGLAKRD